MKDLQVFKDYYGLVATDNQGTKIYGWENISQERKCEAIEIEEDGGMYGYVHKGTIHIKDNGRKYVVKEGQWFSTKSKISIIPNDGPYRICAFQKLDYDGMSTIGLVEDYGRLNYIDGCKDTILSNPIKKGMPCLNALYMPDGVHQTMHTHPSTRCGFIIIGGARAVTPNSDTLLETGMIFYLPTDTEHKFVTDFGEFKIMKLVAYHPDSDYGATDEVHPMINRTIVDGVSASKIKSIQTKT